MDLQSAFMVCFTFSLIPNSPSAFLTAAEHHAVVYRELATVAPRPCLWVVMANGDFITGTICSQILLSR